MRKVSAPSFSSTKRSTRSQSNNATKGTNSIVIDKTDQQIAQLTTPTHSEVLVPKVLDTSIIHSPEELLYFMKHDSQSHPDLPDCELCFLKGLLQEEMYPYVFGDGNCAIYSILLTIKPLSYDVISFEKPKRDRAHIAYITRKLI